MQNERAVHKLENYKDAVERLKESIALKPGNPLGIDAVIKRFEFTFEMSWKCLKVFLQEEGVECKTPRECFNKAFEMDYIDDEDVWLSLLNDRNLSSHIYSQQEAAQICKRVEDKYIMKFESLLAKLKK